MCMWLGMHVCLWKTEANLKHFPQLLSILYFFYLHVCVFRCLYTSVCLPVVAQGWWELFLLSSSTLFFLGRISQLNAKLIHTASLPSELAPLIPCLSFKAGIIGRLSQPQNCTWILGIWTLVLLLTHKHFNHWVIFLTLHIIFKTGSLTEAGVCQIS